MPSAFDIWRYIITGKRGWNAESLQTIDRLWKKLYSKSHKWFLRERQNEYEVEY